MCDEKQAENTAGPMAIGTRQEARGVLVDNIRHAEDRAESLRVLLKAIPWDVLDRDSEESLWRYFASRDH